MTLVEWLVSYPDFQARYTRAREIGFDVFAEITLAEATADLPPEKVPAAKLKWDARRWHLSKMMPKRYGDKVVQELTGPDGGPLQAQTAVAMLTHPQVNQRIQALFRAQEKLADLRPKKDATDGERLEAIMASDAPLTPALYSAVYGDEGKE